MLKSFAVAKDFLGVPHLPPSTFMTQREGKLELSTDKVNVLVGPNGSGKTAFLKTLTLRFMTHFSGASALDDGYVSGSGSDAYWHSEHEWGGEQEYLRGLTCETDNAPAAFYRPFHVPANEANATHAMCRGGYSKQVAIFRELTWQKSSGQQGQALLGALMKALKGEELPTAYDCVNWRYGRQPKDKWGLNSYERRAEALRALTVFEPSAIPLILMDEPEQSLDARAEAQLWRQIAAADCSKMQVIVATHSLYPLLHRDRFNLIETEAGYVDEVLALAE